MSVQNLFQRWNTIGETRQATITMNVPVRLSDLARIAALAEMYPFLQQEEIMSALLGASLNELESLMPYKAGEQIIGEDELGMPVYADEGPTPRFLSLTQKHLAQLKSTTQNSGMAH